VILYVSSNKSLITLAKIRVILLLVQQELAIKGCILNLLLIISVRLIAATGRKTLHFGSTSTSTSTSSTSMALEKSPH
jgi:hypothetical protein